jgi:hypothetical protein
MRTVRAIFFVTAIVVACPPLWPDEVTAEVGAEAVRVQVGADQTTTVVGSFESLAGLLRTLCAEAGVELRAYDAPDRAITTHQEGRPLAATIERLLSQENYLLGVREGEAPGPRVRVAWVRVTGAKNSGLGGLSGGVDVPSRFGDTELEHESTADARRAQQAVAARLLADDAHVASFLQAEPRALAQSLGHYPHIDGLLRKLRAEQQHPAVIEKLDAVIRELEAPSATPSD